ncbi:sucrose non-fermenting protein kinase 1-like [Pecten maximus]|uniref:sucrose non-fermenting protein kinase 1-like n=1 Tax=Pecten maximus TaxID=6579 RepID=UPI0014589679|nr:sucrose non-fermenting protein kinase 1-like [Pecten maximus]
MVKPHAGVNELFGQPDVDGSSYKVMEQLSGENSDGGLEKTQKLFEYSSCMSSDVLNDCLDMQDEYGNQKIGGTGEMSDNENDLEKQHQRLLDGSFNNIQSDHRHGRVDDDLYGGPGIRCLDQCTSNNQPDDLKVLDGCNIHIKEKSFGQQLVTMKQECQLQQDPKTLMDENEKLVCSLGKGTEAECILYQNVHTNKLVVHKKYYGKPRTRERDTLEALRGHRNIPAVYGTAMDDGHHVLRMEFCGQSLRQWRKHRGQVTETEIWAIFEQFTDGLIGLDHHGVIHRDLKPDNACISKDFITKDFIIKLIDFGSVKTAQDKVSQGGRVTAAYMAPEMWLWCFCKSTPISSKVDVFACGLIICFLVYEFDVVPKALETNDHQQMQYKMIHYPSQVAEYVKRTFPVDKYSEALKTLLLKTLDGNPSRRISAADAHEQIVTHMSPSNVNTKHEDEEIKGLGIDMVNHTTSLNILTPSATAPFTETVLGVGKVYHLPDFLTSQKKTDFPSARVAISSIADNDVSLDVSSFPTYHLDLMGQATAISSFGTELTLPNCSFEQPSAAVPIRIMSAEAPRATFTESGSNQHIDMGGTVPTNTTQRYQVQCTNASMGITEPMSFMTDISPQQCSATLANQGSKPIVPNSQSMILYQEQLNEIQPLGESNHPATIVDEGTAVSEAVQEEPDRQANPEVLMKLSDLIRNGSRKRNLPDLPTEFTNLPNLDMIQCKKKRR